MSGCPTPDKTRFTSEHAAKRGLRALRNPHGLMHTYRCGAHWHLGHTDAVDHGKSPTPTRRQRQRRARAHTRRNR